MKDNIVRISILVFGAVAAFAQSVSTLRANIPFEFSAPGATMPAGAYDIALHPDALTLRAVDGRVIASVATGRSGSESPREGAKLVFHRIGDRYFLAQVSAESTYSRQVPITKQERTLAKRGPLPGSTPDRVVVAGR